MAANTIAVAPLVMRIVSASVSVSHKVGRMIRKIMDKGDLGIVDKGKNDLQTEADRTGQRCIIASLHRHFPKVAIYGEESLDPTEYIDPEFIEEHFDEEVLSKKCPEKLVEVKDEEIVVWVDPLDGTQEYTQGLLDHVTVLIGVAVNGTAVGGVIYQPFYNYQAGPDAKLGRCIWGVIGLGSFGFNPQPPPAGENIITTTRSHSDRIVTETVEACEPSSVLRVGGAGHKVLLLLEGKAHSYVFASGGTKKWDTCAPEAVLHAIGGRLTDMFGNLIQYHDGVLKKNSLGVLASVNEHDWYVKRIPQQTKDFLSEQHEKLTSKLS